MRLADVCLVVDDVDAVCRFYREVVGLQPRMRNENFADFVLFDGARLAMWEWTQVAETVGEGRLSDRGDHFSLSVVMTAEAEVDRVRERLGEHVLESDFSERGRSLRFRGPDGATVRVASAGPDSAMERTGFVRFDEIGLDVRDLDRATSFYIQLGFAESRRTEGATRLGGDGTRLKLRCSSENRRRLGAAKSARQSRCGLLCAIEVASRNEVDTLYDRLRLGGVDFSGPPKRWPWGAWATYFSDPDRNLWEIYTWVAEPYTW